MKKYSSLGELAMSKANKRRWELDLPEILCDAQGNPIRLNRKGKFVKIKFKFVHLYSNHLLSKNILNTK